MKLMIISLEDQKEQFFEASSFEFRANQVCNWVKVNFKGGYKFIYNVAVIKYVGEVVEVPDEVQESLALPPFQKANGAGFVDLLCPNCGKHVGYADTCTCGQRIDWGF